MADKVGKSSVAKKLIKDQRVLLAIVIAIIIVVVSIINPNFIGISNIVAIFQQICVLGILTMAMSILLISGGVDLSAVSYTHLRAHETGRNLVCRLLLEKKKKKNATLNVNSE